MLAPRTYWLGDAPEPDADVDADADADAWVVDASSLPPELARDVDRGATVWRLRPVGTAGFESDLASVLKSAVVPGDGVLMLQGVRNIADVCAIVERCPHVVLPVIDSAVGLDQMRAIANVPGVARLVFDGRALQRQLHIEDDEALAAFRSQCVLVSLLAGLPAPVDDSALPASRARALGFGAKLCRSAAELRAACAAFDRDDVMAANAAEAGRP